MNPIIKLSDNAALRIKEIMSNAEKDSIGVRVSVKSGGCAGMSYVMEYTKELNPNDEVIEDKGVKVFVDSAAICICLALKWIIKRRNCPLHLCSIILMKLSVAVAESLSKYHKLYYPIYRISVLHYMHI